jgi:hypothetical protein
MINSPFPLPPPAMLDNTILPRDDEEIAWKLDEEDCREGQAIAFEFSRVGMYSSELN